MKAITNIAAVLCIACLQLGLLFAVLGERDNAMTSVLVSLGFGLVVAVIQIARPEPRNVW